jgi:hypothetical protein
MYWRLALGAVVWAAALGLFVVALQPADRQVRLEAPQHAGALARRLNAPQSASGQRWWSWRVTRAVSAQRAMIVEVEAERLADARAIAMQIIEPVRTHGYDEILIYVRAAGAPAAAASRRVQWTPRGGLHVLQMPD